MKIKHLFLAISLLFGTFIYAQCGSCNDVGNNINPNGINSFTATSAQAYYWEVCSGNATISGSNTNQTVSINCSSNYTVKLTRFVNGNCIESCEYSVCDTVPQPCPTSNNLYYLNEGGGGLCTTGLAILSGVSNVNHINWTWALGGYTGSITSTGTTTPIYYPSGNWNNYYIVIRAQVVFNNGQTCNFVSRSFLLRCGSGPGGPIDYYRTSIYPNPTKGSLFVKTEKEVAISKITISNSHGLKMKSVKTNFSEAMDLSRLDKGIYTVRIDFADGSSETKKLILEK